MTSGRLGDLVSVDWRENLSHQHFVHSFVRGNWSNTGRSAPMILAKCSHDLDLLYWMIGRRPRRVGSFGSLRHFTSASALPDMPARCTDGCPHQETCLWFAPRVYLGADTPDFMRDPVSLDHRPEGMLRGLRTGPYGRCVYRCDNDAVDHQVLNIDFGEGLAVSMTMQGASHREGRTLRFDGMRATLLGDQATNRLVIHDHRSGETETVHPGGGDADQAGGHGGGDGHLLEEFVGLLRGERPDAATEAAESLESHLLAFAAEASRRSGQVVEMATFREALGA